MEKQTQVVEFKKNPTLEKYTNIIELNFDDYSKCLVCNEHIFYYDTKLSLTRKKTINIQGKNYNSFKKVNNKIYTLKICEECLTLKYPDYQEKNKSRVFNQCNKYSKYAYCIDEKDFIKQHNKYVVNSIKDFIKKYGEEEGEAKWEDYCNKQKHSNSLEYKKQKHGWSEHEFNKFNKSRSSTLENFIIRHGEEEGKIKWEDYKNNLSLKNSKNEYIKNHSLKKWETLCKSKAHTLENYIKWYGTKEKALEKIEKRHNMWKTASKSSQKFFNDLYDKLFKNYNLEVIYDNKNGYEHRIITKKNKVYYLDFYIPSWNICIEYNGDIFHGNPTMFEDNDILPVVNKTAKEIREKDLIRYKTLEEEFNIKTIVIWEKESKTIDLDSFIDLIYKNKI